MTSSYRGTLNVSSSQGLWALSAEPGPGFKWGAIKRRSAYDPDGTENSTARQEDAIYAWVEQHNEGRIVATYTDIASGFNPRAKRTEYENALEDLKAGRINGIIVWKLDRLTRQRSQIRRIIALLQECGGRLVSVHENIDTADPDKKQITDVALALYAGIAEGESEAISARVRLMNYDRARKGLAHRGGERPFGHSTDMSELVADEVKLLHEAGERVLADEAVFSIARDFTRREVKTTRGATLWHPEVLMSMLRSPRMVGMLRHDGILYPASNVPAIFETATWERICAKLEHKPAAPSEIRLLSNIANCGICSNHLRSSGSGNPRGKRGRDPSEFCYRCRNKTRIRDDGACGKLYITGVLADEEVSRRTIAFLSDRENIERILLTYADKENLAAIQARVAELTESRQDLYDARFTPPPGMPKLPEDVFYEKLKAVEDERDELMRSSDVTREAEILKKLLKVDDVAAEWEQRGVRWQRAILKLVVATIIIEPRGKALEPGMRPDERRFDPTRIRMQFVGDVIE
jgi:site-specific DNA recombinase